MLNRLRQIAQLGQAIWLDFISREFLQSGRLAELVDAGVAGVTSNPTIFHKAISGSSVYDADIAALVREGRSAPEIYEALTIADVGAAADVLRNVYNETHGRDGYVSIEVSPRLAHDTAGTVAEARRLYHALRRPNIMIKVPATEAGLPAISTLIGEGINVNVTLIFSLAMYERVMESYAEGLRRLRAIGRPLGLVSSVASFFVSRVDTLVDKVIDHRIAHGEPHLEQLYGLAAVANAKLAYARFKAFFNGPRFAELRSLGARPQRPLWASTSTKNPRYPATKYVDPLIGVHTVNTVPLQTLEAIEAQSIVAQSIDTDVERAEDIMRQLAGLQIEMDWVTACLLDEGVQLFVDSYDTLLADISRKREQMALPA